MLYPNVISYIIRKNVILSALAKHRGGIIISIDFIFYLSVFFDLLCLMISPDKTFWYITTLAVCGVQEPTLHSNIKHSEAYTLEFNGPGAECNRECRL